MSIRAKMHAAGRSITQNLRTDWGVEGPYQWGTIAAITPGVGGAPSTVSVYLDNSSTGTGAVITTGLTYVNGYIPTVGDVVLIGRMAGAARTQRIILGPLETSGRGMTQAGAFSGTSFKASGIAGLNNATPGGWIGSWSNTGPPTFTGYTPAPGDWGYDGNFIQWVYNGTVWTSGPLGYVARITGASISGVSNVTVDLTGGVLNWTALPGRRYKMQGRAHCASGSQNDIFSLILSDGNNNELDRDSLVEDPGNNNKYLDCIVFLTPAAGPQTHKLRLLRTAGSGGSSASNGSLWVEDVGNAPLWQGVSSAVWTGSGTRTT